MRNFVECAADKQWGADKMKEVCRGVRPRLTPTLPACPEQCRRNKRVERGKALIQFTQRCLSATEVLRQITADALGDRLDVVSDALQYCAGMGYSKQDWLKFRQLLMNAD